MVINYSHIDPGLIPVSTPFLHLQYPSAPPVGVHVTLFIFDPLLTQKLEQSVFSVDEQVHVDDDA